MRTHGVTQFATANSEFDGFLETVSRRGWHISPKIFDDKTVADAKAALNEIYDAQYTEAQGRGVTLEKIFDENVVRMPFMHDRRFYDFIFNDVVIDSVRRIIGDKFILMLQNAPLNRPVVAHQGFSWHRDLTWQHFSSSRPLSVTITVALDDYTVENGGMEVIAGSHKFSEFPSDNYVAENIQKILAPAGAVITFDSMLFHRAGYNTTNQSRSLIVMVFTLPLIKQQICIPTMLGDPKKLAFNPEQIDILGYGSESATSVLDWRFRRTKLV